MNIHTLNQIAKSSEALEASMASDLVHVCQAFPFFALPHQLLAKHYYLKQDFRAENTLFKAALRTHNREWLYHFITSQKSSISDVSLEVQMAETPIEPIEIIATAFETESEPTEIVQSEIFLPSSELLLEIDPEVELNSLSGLFQPNVVEETSVFSILETNEDMGQRSKLFDPDIDHPLLTPNFPNPMPFGGYNIEQIYTSNTQEEQPTQSVNPELEEETDFFAWLNKGISDIDKANKLDRNSIIDKFLKEKPSISRPKAEFYTPEKAMKRSEVLDNSFATETLATIYLKQGYPEKAIKVYLQLQLKFPEKMSYFADLIEKIKHEHEL